MKTIEASTLGFKLNVKVPDTVEEYDTLAKAKGACLDSASKNVLYRSTYAKFRNLFSDRIENFTSIERKTELTGKKLKDDDGNVTEEDGLKYIETEKIYFDRVCAELVGDGKFDSLDAAAASFLSTAQEVIDSIPFDPSEPERASSGPKKVAKQYLELATKAEANGKLDVLTARLQEALGATWKVEATVDSVAKAIAEDQRRQRELKKLDAEYDL